MVINPIIVMSSTKIKKNNCVLSVLNKQILKTPGMINDPGRYSYIIVIKILISSMKSATNA